MIPSIVEHNKSQKLEELLMLILPELIVDHFKGQAQFLGEGQI